MSWVRHTFIILHAQRKKGWCEARLEGWRMRKSRKGDLSRGQWTSQVRDYELVECVRTQTQHLSRYVVAKCLWIHVLKDECDLGGKGESLHQKNGEFWEEWERGRREISHMKCQLGEFIFQGFWGLTGLVWTGQTIWISCGWVNITGYAQWTFAKVLDSVLNTSCRTPHLILLTTLSGKFPSNSRTAVLKCHCPILIMPHRCQGYLCNFLYLFDIFYSE